MKILYLITARGGSKGVPNKNLRQIGGLSLVAFKAVSARRSKYCTRLIVSSDSAAIQREAEKRGAEVPFTRPAELSTDTSSSFEVISHAMAWIEANSSVNYEAVMLLEPSSPFARSIDYDRAVELMESRKANVVVGVRETEVNSVFVGQLEPDSRMTRIIERMVALKSFRRQDMAPEYTMNGALYLFRWDFFQKERRIYADPLNTYGYIMEPHYSIEIDSLMNLHWAEFLVQRGYVDMTYWR